MNFLSGPQPALDALAKGDLGTARRLFGCQYSLRGVVVHGDHLGKQLGFPTANLLLDPQSPLLIPFGVYLVDLTLGQDKKFGLSSIGMRPTVNGKDLRVEVHILDFSGDLYGKGLEVFFLERLRDELRFGSLDELKSQMEKDRATALELIPGWNKPDSHS
jgi:riboflavin kinase/FMN adenylyltransferase